MDNGLGGFFCRSGAEEAVGVEVREDLDVGVVVGAEEDVFLVAFGDEGAVVMGEGENALWEAVGGGQQADGDGVVGEVERVVGGQGLDVLADGCGADVVFEGWLSVGARADDCHVALLEELSGYGSVVEHGGGVDAGGVAGGVEGECAVGCGEDEGLAGDSVWGVELR